MLRQEGVSALASDPQPLPEKMEEKVAEEGSCTECLNKEMRMISICPSHERTELFIDSQVRDWRVETLMNRVDNR